MPTHTSPVNIPTIDDCAQLMEQYGMLPHIRHHSLVVAQIADLLATRLQGSVNGHPPPQHQLCVTGALLHDIAKTPCLNGSCDHARKGGEICRQHNYPAIAEIVEEHVILKNFTPDLYRAGKFTAKEIVYYADKRVRHAEIVSLEERLEYILEQYGNNDKQLHSLIKSNFNQCLELEQILFTFLCFPPEQLARQVEQQELSVPGL